MSSVQIAAIHEQVPPGVLSRHRASSLYPVQVPDLIGVKDRHYLDRSGLQQHRGIVDLMRYGALNQGADDLASYNGFIPADFGNFKKLPDPTDPDNVGGRYSDDQLYALALYVYSLQPPANPNRFDAVAARGQKVFEREGCVGCHTPPLYTNNKLTPAKGFAIPEDHKKKYAILPISVGTDYESSLSPALIFNSPPPIPSGSFAGFVVPANYSHPLPAGVTRLGNNTLADTATPLHNVGPRFGFAWQPLSNSHSLVVRGGYGAFYTVTNGNSVLQTLGAQPFVSRVSLTGTANAAATFQDPYTVQLTPGVWQPRTPMSQLSETLVAPNYDSPMTQQFSLDVQGAVLPSTVLEVAYVGTRGTRLSESRALNEARLATPDDPISGVTTNTLTNVAQRVPFLGFAPTGATSIETYGFSMFHSLQATLKREFNHGVQFQAAYTW